MILIGRYRSPFTRRVAIALRHLGFAYEHRPLTAWSNLAEVREVNPVGRVPALILDSGEVLFDSGAIIDHLDQRVGPARALVPAEETRQREVLRVVACAMGVLEKVVAALYERTMHPPEKVHPPWIAHNESQARSGLAWLDQGRRELEPDGPITQAHVTTVAMFDFTRLVNPDLVPAGQYPRLDAVSDACNRLDAFARTQPVSPVDRADPALPG
jgi:glutathione S-transferase